MTHFGFDTWGRRMQGGLVLAGVCLAATWAGSRAQAGQWTGREAPPAAFGAANHTIAPGQKLADFRGEVVLLTFWFRDCPHCRAYMPTVQARYERWTGFGLRVITVIDRYTPEQFQPVMQQFGWTFPVVADVNDAIGRTYGVGRRPDEYLIGHDGRVLAGGTVSNAALESALAAWRLSRLAPWPAGSNAVRDHVAAGRYPDALKVPGTAEPLMGRLEAEARRHLGAWSEALARRVRARSAHRADVDRFVAAWGGTALAAEAQAAGKRLVEALPGR